MMATCAAETVRKADVAEIFTPLPLPSKSASSTLRSTKSSSRGLSSRSPVRTAASKGLEFTTQVR
jgi:hypothetical protein